MLASQHLLLMADAAWGPCTDMPVARRASCRCLTQMGTQSESFVQLTERIGRKTGGLSVSPFLSDVRGCARCNSFISSWLLTYFLYVSFDFTYQALALAPGLLAWHA